MPIQVTPREKGRKRGGQPKHWAEQARVWVWYAEIKRRCNWSDYQLDFEFALTEEGRSSIEPDERPRTFEWIRKSARKPRGVDRRWRSMRDLVDTVDRDLRFAGTKALYDAEIWGLLQYETLSPDAVQAQVERLLAANRLTRVPVERAYADAPALIREFGPVTLFDRSLRLSLSHLNRLVGIELLWLLYLQTEPPRSSSYRIVVEEILDRELDRFFADVLPDRHLVYYDEAISVLLGARLDLSSDKGTGYGFMETLGAWPIVPIRLMGGAIERLGLASSEFARAER